jgi:hypothetical protein
MGEVVNMRDWKKGRIATPTATGQSNANLLDEDGNYLASAKPIIETPAGERVILTSEAAFCATFITTQIDPHDPLRALSPDFYRDPVKPPE